MHAIGPYEFTGQDVATTLGAARTLFDLLPAAPAADGEDPTAPFRATATDALERMAPTDPVAALGVVWGEWRLAMHALRAAGAYGPEATGAVVGTFVSDGGSPKAPRDELHVGFGGVEGDRQDDRLHHGRPWQAVCLWSADVIADFVASGHPLAPGLAGENVTVEGIAWDRMVPGAQLRVGETLLEVSAYAVPCKKNAGWFLEGAFDLMHHRHGPVSRMYATVLEPGTIRRGDPAVLEPGAGSAV